MSDTVLIRKENKTHIRQLMSDGREHTVYDMMDKSGLSVATVNSILAELAEEGALLREKRQLNGVGRATWIYKINPEFESMMIVRIFPNEHKITFTNMYCYGGLIENYTVTEKQTFLKPILESLRKKQRKISSCVISVPPHTGINSYLAEMVEKETGIPCAFHDEMYYYAVQEKKRKRQTYMDFSRDTNPSITNIYEGKIVTENSALMFKEFENKEHLFSENRKTMLESVGLYVRMVLSVFPSGEIVFGGDMVEEEDVPYLKEVLAKYHFYPALSFLVDKDVRIMGGMTDTALLIRKVD